MYLLKSCSVYRIEAIAAVVSSVRANVAHQLSGQCSYEHVAKQAQATVKDQGGHAEQTTQQVQPQRIPSQPQQLLRRHVGQLDRS